MLCVFFLLLVCIFTFISLPQLFRYLFGMTHEYVIAISYSYINAYVQRARTLLLLFIIFIFFFGAFVAAAHIYTLLLFYHFFYYGVCVSALVLCTVQIVFTAFDSQTW